MAKVLITGQGQPIKDRISKLVRCSGCEFLHENGNCLKVGCFYSSVKVYHFIDDDTFETTCCGTDVTNKDFKYCPNCGQKLGEVEEVGETNE